MLPVHHEGQDEKEGTDYAEHRSDGNLGCPSHVEVAKDLLRLLLRQFGLTADQGQRGDDRGLLEEAEEGVLVDLEVHLKSEVGDHGHPGNLFDTNDQIIVCLIRLNFLPFSVMNVCQLILDSRGDLIEVPLGGYGRSLKRSSQVYTS